MRVFFFVVAFLGIAAGLSGKVFFDNKARNITNLEFTGLERSFENSILRSPINPAVSIVLDPSYEYLGGQKFILNGGYFVEQQVFAQAHTDGGTKRLVCFQFESISPQFEGAYDYSSAPLQRSLGELDFFVDTIPGKRHSLFPLGIPGTDGFMFRKLAKENGYLLPQHFIWTRFAHVPADDARKELLVIVYDDIGGSGLIAEDLKEGGSAVDRWQPMSEANLASISESITISRLD